MTTPLLCKSNIPMGGRADIVLTNLSDAALALLVPGVPFLPKR
jgi:hypothetical protein